ncbi:MAG: aspartate aminotransferase family protein [Planctomycetota bacterium]|nr:MAG: aspartate aminotransferase family protein [Planctomycetota bacterium]
MSTATVASSRIVDAYRRRTPTSAKLAAAAKNVFPDGVTHDARYLEPYGIYVQRAAGSRKWDVDDNEYVDYAGGHGALLLGHNPPEVVEAVQKQLHLGTHYGANHELEIRWGELVKKLVPCAERVRFTSSGTEATLLGMRLARAFTGKPKMLRFVGHFHGWHDHAAFGVGSHFDGTPTPGVVDGIAQNVVLVPAGDVEATRRALDEHKDIGMAIIEPTGSSWGHVPVAPSFLHELRRLTAERGVLLFFDEVITGFRCSPGGAQQALGIKPDLTTLAKILAGGLPGGALVGRQDIMDALNTTASAQAGREKIAHHGTYNANPLSAAAGVAMLELVANTDACERANRYAEQLRTEMNRVLADDGVNWVVYGTYSSFHIFTNPKGLSVTPEEIVAGKLDYHAIKGGVRKEVVMRLRQAMMLHGVEIFVWPGGPTSAVHTLADLEQTCEAFAGALKMLKEDGLIG